MLRGRYRSGEELVYGPDYGHPSVTQGLVLNLAYLLFLVLVSIRSLGIDRPNIVNFVRGIAPSFCDFSSFFYLCFRADWFFSEGNNNIPSKYLKALQKPRTNPGDIKDNRPQGGNII